MSDGADQANIQTANITFYSEKSQKKTQAHVEFLVWDNSMAKKKALIGLWICWGLAIITIPIPIVHFVSVPLLILAGPVATYAVYKLHLGSIDLLSGQGSCPDCGGKILLEKQPASWPISNHCPHCQAALQAIR